ncbi:MAG TPA: hypothetical protein PK166_09485 [Candidatus Hydrogenedentes bacterium]|nr:hypothetical protein [Candidatus Hydrogenedentota bacterium]HQH68617.1 hypothetical protein [Candidatus Hydrogenedentota bacterium]
MGKVARFLLRFAVCAALAGALEVPAAETRQNPPLSGKTLGTIFNNDLNNILYALDGSNTTPKQYQAVVQAILDMQPGVLAQNVGLPDPVIYPTAVGTTFDKYLVEVSRMTWPENGGADAERQRDALRSLFAAETDPLTLTIEACRARGLAIVASFRMNAEDWYDNTYLLSDFGRAHPEYRISGAGNLDPAVDEVYAHRMALLTEAAQRYDVDGLELDFRRWYRMVSNPLENHTVLTRMVRDTRKMLDETARMKKRDKLLLGVRVGPSLDSEPSPYLFPGIFYAEKPTNASCKELGLDVAAWFRDGLVDYVCPSLFLATLPGEPLTQEFAKLAEGTQAGVYPTLWPHAAWMHGIGERRVERGDDKALALYKHDLCQTVLDMYRHGADGISTFNWYAHLRNANVPHLWTDGEGAAGAGAEAVQTYAYPLLRDPDSIEEYLRRPWAIPPEPGNPDAKR